MLDSMLDKETIHKEPVNKEPGNIDVSNLSSFKLGYLMRMSRVKNVSLDRRFVREIRKELMNRGHYETELNRKAPH